MEKFLPNVSLVFRRFCSLSGAWMNRTGLQGFGSGFSRFPWMLTILTFFLVKNPVVLAENGPNSITGLEISKAVDVSSVNTGTVFTYTIQYRAASLSQNFTGVKITDVLPASLDFVSAVGSQHTTGYTYDPLSKTIIFNFIDPLPAGSTGEELRSEPAEQSACDRCGRPA